MGEFSFRGLVIRYATALTLLRYLRMQGLGQLGAEIAAEMGMTISPLLVRAMLKKAMSLCEQPGAYHMDIITEAINGISIHLR
jgi:hypothetical protein